MNLSENSTQLLISGDFDPSATAVSASKGTIFVDTSTATLWQKQDDGVTMNFTQLESGAGAGANTALSNLTATSINQDLVPNADGTVGLGSATKRFLSLFAETAKDNTSVISVDFQNRQLLDAAGLESIDFANRGLLDSTGGTSVDWSTPGLTNLNSTLLRSYRIVNRFVTGTDNISSTDNILILNGVASPFNLSLPAGVAGMTFTFAYKSTDAGTWTLIPFGGDTLDGFTSPPNEITFNSGTWYVV